MELVPALPIYDPCTDNKHVGECLSKGSPGLETLSLYTCQGGGKPRAVSRVA